MSTVHISFANSAQLTFSRRMPSTQIRNITELGRLKSICLIHHDACGSPSSLISKRGWVFAFFHSILPRLPDQMKAAPREISISRPPQSFVILSNQPRTQLACKFMQSFPMLQGDDKDSICPSRSQKTSLSSVQAKRPRETPENPRVEQDSTSRTLSTTSARSTLYLRITSTPWLSLLPFVVAIWCCQLGTAESGSKGTQPKYMPHLLGERRCSRNSNESVSPNKATVFTPNSTQVLGASFPLWALVTQTRGYATRCFFRCGSSHAFLPFPRPMIRSLNLSFGCDLSLQPIVFGEKILDSFVVWTKNPVTF